MVPVMVTVMADGGGDGDGDGGSDSYLSGQSSFSSAFFCDKSSSTCCLGNLDPGKPRFLGNKNTLRFFRGSLGG